MSLIETILGKKSAPGGGLAALFGRRKPKRHKLPSWAAEKAKKS